MPLSYHWNLCVYFFIRVFLYNLFSTEKKTFRLNFVHVWKSIIIFWWYNQDYIWANKIHTHTHNLSTPPASFCFSFFFSSSFYFVFYLISSTQWDVGNIILICVYTFKMNGGFIDYLLLPKWLCSARQFIFKYDSSLLSISLSNTLVTFPIS